MKQIKIRETFEYTVEVKDDKDKENIFMIKDYVDCVDDMCCPFWDGYIPPEITKRDFEIVEEKEIED